MGLPARIGVTGGIGAGKSVLVRELAARGCATFSSDDVVHALYARDPDLRREVTARWGDAILDDAGAVSRDAIAAIVFNDDGERRWLESVVHPLVAREWLRFIDAVGEDVPAIVAEVPLLFEAGLEDRYDLTVLVTAPLETRLARVGQRAHGALHAAERAAAQLTDEQRAARAGFVVVNDGTPDQLSAAAGEVLAAAGRG